MITQVIEIHSIEHLNSAAVSQLGQELMQLPFAVVTAILWIAGVGGITQLCCGLLPVLHPKPTRLPASLLQQMGRKGW